MDVGDLPERRRPDLVDRVAAVALTIAGLTEVGLENAGLLSVELVLSIVATSTVIWRRRYPAQASLIAVLATLGVQAAGGRHVNPLFQVVAAMACIYILGRQAPLPMPIARWAVVLTGTLAGVVVISAAAHSLNVGAIAGRWPTLVLPFVAGHVLSTVQATARELQATTARLDLEQKLVGRRAAIEERNGVAREIHDAIAHDLTVMVIHTGAARAVAGSDPAAAQRSMGFVAGAGESALLELDRVLGIMIVDGDDRPGIGAGVADLPELTERMSQAGLPVALIVEPGLTDIGASVGLVVYRLVQEALTNSLKHADATMAEVRVGLREGAVSVQVVDDGAGRPTNDVAVPSGATGYGLSGMRERVALYGGEIRAGRRDSGGFEVRARIPLRSAT